MIKNNNKSKITMVWVMALAFVQACVVVDNNDDRRRGEISCGGNHILRVVSLEMSPDPVASGQRINSFRVRLRADGSGECVTRIRIDDRDQTVATRTAFRLRPGLNDITLVPTGSYRYDRDEHCFTVLADIARSYRAIDAEKRFCVRQSGRGRWTMN